MSKTYLVLGKTGVGKSIFINDISEGKTNLLVKNTKNAENNWIKCCSINKNWICYKFIDTPGLQVPKGDKSNIIEIQKAASEYPDFAYIIILLSFQEDRIYASIIKTLETYMKIFPIQYFWEHVLLLYSKVFLTSTGIKAQQKLKEKIEKSKGDFVRAIRFNEDFNDFRISMYNNNINLLEHIEEYFVNSEEDISDIDNDTKLQYNNILNKLNNGYLLNDVYSNFKISFPIFL